MTTVLSRVDTTTNDYRKSAVRWARGALQPGAAVILGIETTTPEAGAISGKVGYSDVLNTGIIKDVVQMGILARQQFRPRLRAKKRTRCPG